ncbi:MAG: tetratricopeptide repeat protein, partial [Thermoguttaceae bacterium]|nr:tetratricopeptide repeat protein [Thermoguttaceae bacterium]
MKSTVLNATLLAMILAGTSAMIGCSSFSSSGSSDYVGPEGLSKDVSDLPNPNAPPSKTRNDFTESRSGADQYAYGRRTPESPEKILLQANSHFDQKRYHDSERLYKKYLATPEGQAAPAETLSAIHFRLGTVARKKVRLSEAKNEFKQAYQFAPLNDDYLFSYAKVSYEAGDYQEADQGFVTLLNRRQNYPDALYYYGLTLLESSNRTNALQPLTASVGELEAQALLTDKYYENGELEQAFQSENQTIQIAARLGRQIPDFPHKTRALGAPLSTLATNAPAMLTPGVQNPVSPGATSVGEYVDAENASFYAPSTTLSIDAPAQGYFSSSNATVPSGSFTGYVPATEGAHETSAPFVSYKPADEPNNFDKLSQNENFVPTTESSGSIAAIAPTTESVSELSPIPYPPLTTSEQMGQLAEQTGSVNVPNERDFATASFNSPQMETGANQTFSAPQINYETNVLASTSPQPQGTTSSDFVYINGASTPSTEGFANSGQFDYAQQQQTAFAPTYAQQTPYQTAPVQTPYLPVHNDAQAYATTPTTPYATPASMNAQPSEEDFAFATSGSSDYSTVPEANTAAY